MRIWLALFIAGLVLSGVTAFPLKRELSMILGILGDFRSTTRIQTGYLASHGTRRIGRNRSALSVFGLRTDWLAFGHLAIAAAFRRSVDRSGET